MDSFERLPLPERIKPTLENIQKLARRRAKLGKTDLRLRIAAEDLDLTETVGRTYASSPGYRAALRHIHYFDLSGRGGQMAYELVIDWSNEPNYLLEPSVSLRPYAPYPSD